VVLKEKQAVVTEVRGVVWFSLFECVCVFVRIVTCSMRAGEHVERGERADHRGGARRAQGCAQVAQRTHPGACGDTSCQVF
jgi:hypothetical protein